jgi:plasmid stability protein
MTRLPEALCRRLEREAAREGRSMNAEIIHRLQQSFEASNQTSGLDERLRKLEQAVFQFAAKKIED